MDTTGIKFTFFWLENYVFIRLLLRCTALDCISSGIASKGTINLEDSQVSQLCSQLLTMYLL